eukprot:Skav227187  [mRNA]  locus=scaffold2048:68037:102381:+ [translate_table: standard]
MEEGQALLETEPTETCHWRPGVVMLTLLMTLLSSVLVLLPRQSANAPLRVLVPSSEQVQQGLEPETRQMPAELELLEKTKELARLLRVLRHPQRVPDWKKLKGHRNDKDAEEKLETTKDQIFKVLPFLQGKVSPLHAAKLGIAFTTDDLAALGRARSLDDMINLADVLPGANATVRARALRGRRLSIAAGRPWTGGVIPFCFDEDVGEEIKEGVQRGTQEWIKAVRCLAFNETARNHSTPSGCSVDPAVLIRSKDGDGWYYSYLADPGEGPGMQQGPHELQLEHPATIGTIIHELGHVLGMTHEHQRPMRDNYVQVHWKNVEADGLEAQFVIETWADTQTDYDILSIMHYGKGSNDLESIWMSPKAEACEHYQQHGSDCSEAGVGQEPGVLAAMGQEMGLTQLDADTVANLYKLENPLCHSSWDLPGESPAPSALGSPLRQWLPRTPRTFNAVSANWESSAGCITTEQESWYNYTTVGGGQLIFRASGNLEFYRGDGSGGRAVLPKWQSCTSAACGGGMSPEDNPGEMLCYRLGDETFYVEMNRNNIVVWGNGKPLWSSNTAVGPLKGDHLQVYDRHWTIYSEESDGISQSVKSFPNNAPSSIRIEPWTGCITQKTWQTSGGARLEFLNGNLKFFPADGTGDTWETGTAGVGKCLCFHESGPRFGGLYVYSTWHYDPSGETQKFVWRSGSDGLVSPERGSELVVFDHEWSIFGMVYMPGPGFNKVAIATYPPGGSDTPLRLLRHSERLRKQHRPLKTFEDLSFGAPVLVCRKFLRGLEQGYGQTKKINIDRLVGQIRADLEHELSIPDKSLFLMNLSGAAEFKQVLPDDKSLRDLGLKPGDRGGIELRINYYQEQAAEEYVMPDCLELKVMNDRGEERIISVHVQRPVMEKPYFGGYRNKMTGSTWAPRRCITLWAQTYEYRTRSTQCKREAGTQMEKVGLYVDQRDDVVMKPRRPYFSSADKAEQRVQRVCVMIQCHARGMFARRPQLQKGLDVLLHVKWTAQPQDLARPLALDSRVLLSEAQSHEEEWSPVTASRSLGSSAALSVIRVIGYELARRVIYIGPDVFCALCTDIGKDLTWEATGVLLGLVNLVVIVCFQSSMSSWLGTPQAVEGVLTFIVYLVAVVLTHYTKRELVLEGEEAEYFGSIVSTMFSLFQARKMPRVPNDQRRPAHPGNDHGFLARHRCPTVATETLGGMNQWHMGLWWRMFFVIFIAFSVQAVKTLFTIPVRQRLVTAGCSGRWLGPPSESTAAGATFYKFTYSFPTGSTTVCFGKATSSFLEASVLHLEKLPNLMLRDYAVPRRRVFALAILSLLFQNIRCT